MGTDNRRYMLKLINEKDEEIKNLKDQIESLKLESFDLNSTIFSLKNDFYREDERREKMIRNIERENYEMSLLLEEQQREFGYGGYWVAPQTPNYVEAQNDEVPFEKDLYMYGDDEANLHQISKETSKNTNEASTSRKI